MLYDLMYRRENTTNGVGRRTPQQLRENLCFRYENENWCTWLITWTI